MRTIISWVLVGLGGFLVVAAVMATVWAPSQVKKTPIDVSTTTHLQGTADKLNTATGEMESLDVRATSITKTDTGASSDEIVAWVSTTCLVIDEGDVPDCVESSDARLISASQEVFASERTTALGVSDVAGLPETVEPREGLVNKWPFGAAKQDYPYWDGLLGETVTAVYDGTETIEGVETYRYVARVMEEPAEIAEGIQGTYSSEKTIWVEPHTGSIINQSQQEVRSLESGDTVLDLDLAFTEEQVQANAAEAKDNIASLQLITGTVPLVGFIAGPILFIAGLLGLLLGRRPRGGTRATA